MTKIFTRGFTLAEVLITIAIVGIVAAITIPNLIQKNFEKRVVSQLKLTRSMLAQAIRMAEAENGEVSGWYNFYGDMSQEGGEAIANNLKPYIKISIDCGFKNKQRCIPNTRYKNLDGSFGTNYSATPYYYGILLQNGVSIWLRAPQDGEQRNGELMVLFIDINGISQPNTVGKDLFTFTYTQKNGLVPDGQPGTGEANTCNMSSSGWGCAYYVLQNQNMDYLHKK